MLTLRSPPSPLQIGNILSLIYLFLIIVQIIVNLKNKPEAVEKVHLFCSVYFMLYMVAFTGITIWWVAALLWIELPCCACFAMHGSMCGLQMHSLA